MSPYILAQTTFADAEQGAVVVEAVLTDRLAACVQVLDMQSHYVWKGEVHNDTEVLVVFKTRSELADRLRQRVVDLHPYETAEFIVLPITDGHSPYLRWIDESTAEG